MGMRHFQSDDRHTDALAWYGFFNLSGHVPCEQVYSAQKAIFQIKKVILLHFGDDQGMSLGQGIDVQKSQEFIVFCNAMARDFTCYNFAEDGRHGLGQVLFETNEVNGRSWKFREFQTESNPRGLELLQRHLQISQAGPFQ